MLVEALQVLIRTYYRLLGGERFERELDEGLVRGFVSDPDGEPERTVVLVHGLGDASTTWYRIVPALRGEARLVLPDLPPFGLSELAQGYQLDPGEHATLLAEVVDEFAVGPTTVVGQSMGGWVVQWLVHDRGDLVDEAVLVATAGARLHGSFDAVGLLTPHSSGEMMAYLDALWYERPPGMRAVAGDLLDRMHSPKIRAFLAATSHDDTLSEEQLAACSTPLHVVWGRADGLLDAATPGYLAQRWSGPVDRSYLARAGHMVHQERPRALLGIVRDRMERADRQRRVEGPRLSG